jgi:creatinine amidohydrolase
MSNKRFENLNSVQLSEELKKAPVAYFSIGSLEHHGLHLPVGFDAMWIHQACLAAAEKTGGVVLPPTFWGTGPCMPGIEDMPGSLLLRETTITALISDVFDQLVASGYKVIVLIAGHNPGLQGRMLGQLENEYQKKSSTQIRIVQPTNFQKLRGYPHLPKISPDHAAKTETSLAMHLYPELVQMENIELPDGQTNISGVSASEATAETGQEIFESFVEFVVRLVREAL